MNSQRPLWFRRLLPVILLGAYVLALGVSARSILALRDSQRERVASQLENAMRDQVAGWEENLLDILGEWMEVAADDPELAKGRQATMQRRAPWFNALYVWDPPKRVVYGPDDIRMTSVIRFPNRPIDDTDGGASDPYCVCLLYTSPSPRDGLLSRMPSSA